VFNLRSSRSARRVERRVSPCADLLSAVRTRTGLVVAALSCTLLAGACGDELTQPDSELTEQAHALARRQAQRGRAPVRVAPTDPQGGYFVSVSATGKGCPEGSWDTEVSGDGQTFTTRFSGYEVQLTPERNVATLDCTVSIGLHSPQGLSFSVTSLFYGGYGFLEPTMRGTFSARYGFRGNADAGRSYREEYGPYDDTFLFEDQVTQARRTWSPCGADHTLTVGTQLALYNGQPAGSGYANVANINGDTKVVLGLTWRTCKAQRRTAL
jgi:hypothetical protein